MYNYTSSIYYISLSAVVLSGSACTPALVLTCSFLEVVVDWSAKLWSSLWARNGDLASRNRTELTFFLNKVKF